MANFSFADGIQIRFPVEDHLSRCLPRGRNNQGKVSNSSYFVDRK